MQFLANFSTKDGVFITKDGIFYHEKCGKDEKTKNIYPKTVIGVLLKEIWIN